MLAVELLNLATYRPAGRMQTAISVQNNDRWASGRSPI